MSQYAENDAWDCDHHPEWADRRNVCHHPDHKTRCCPTCNGTDLRLTARGRLVCRDCEKRHKRERKDRRHRERGDRCGCGTDAVSLNPAEVVMHNWGGGACRVVPTRHIPPGDPEDSCCTCGDPAAGAICHHVTPPAETDETRGLDPESRHR